MVIGRAQTLRGFYVYAIIEMLTIHDCFIVLCVNTTSLKSCHVIHYCGRCSLVANL